MFDSRDDVLQWARSVAHENGFVAVILRSNTNIGSRGRTMFVLIGCERSFSLVDNFVLQFSFAEFDREKLR